jgi:hypothetical protein
VLADMTGTSFLHGRGCKEAIRAMALHVGRLRQKVCCLAHTLRRLLDLSRSTAARAQPERGQAKAEGGTQLGFAAKNVADF